MIQGGSQALGPVLLQATWRPAPPNRSALTRKVGVQCHPVFSRKPSRRPDGWFSCRAELRPWEREGRRWDVSSHTPPRVKGRSLHLPRPMSSRQPVETPEGRSRWSSSQVPVFPRDGPSSGPSGIPGDLDRETVSNGWGRGSLETIFSALNSWTSLELTGVCGYYPPMFGKVAPKRAHSRPFGAPPPKPGHQAPTTPCSLLSHQ